LQEKNTLARQNSVFAREIYLLARGKIPLQGKIRSLQEKNNPCKTKLDPCKGEK